jgi:hypothetical protein
MAVAQASFLFDAPLTETPASQIPPKPVIPASIPTECEAFVQAALVVLETIADGFDTDTVLEAMGINRLSIDRWHRSRVLEAIRQPIENRYGSSPYGEYQAYRDGTNIRYRRLKPVTPCRGYEGKECTATTRGGVLCSQCVALEAEDEFNQE